MRIRGILMSVVASAGLVVGMGQAAAADPILKIKYVQIQNSHKGYCLVARGMQSALAELTPCINQLYHGAFFPDQYWAAINHRPGPEGRTFVQLKNLHSGLCLVAQDKGANFERAFTFACNAAYEDQFWSAGDGSANGWETRRPTDGDADGHRWTSLENRYKFDPVGMNSSHALLYRDGTGIGASYQWCCVYGDFNRWWRTWPISLPYWA